MVLIQTLTPFKRTRTIETQVRKLSMCDRTTSYISFTPFAGHYRKINNVLSITHIYVTVKIYLFKWIDIYKFIKVFLHVNKSPITREAN